MASMVKISAGCDGCHLPTVLRGDTRHFPPAVDLRSGVTASGSRGGVVDVELLLWLPTGRASGGARAGKPTPCR